MPRPAAVHEDDGEGILAVLFDIDGTLIDSGGAGARSWKLAFDDLYGIPADIGMFSDAGMTDPEVGRLTFAHVIGHEPTGGELARVMAKRLEHLRHTIAESEGYRVLDGVAELLPRLTAGGYLLGLTTGGVEAAAHIKLERGGLNHFFSFGGYGSDSTDRTELTRRAIERGGQVLGGSLDPRRALVVGDTPLDVSAAQAAGAVAVAVATGHFGLEQLRQTGAEHVLGSLREPLPL